MRRHSLIFTIFLALQLFCIVSCANAGKVNNYSADQVSIKSNGKIIDTVKFYVTPDKVRMEPVSKKDKKAPVMIFRQDLGLVWILNAEEKKYLENNLNEEELAKTLKKIPENVKEKDLGTEKINGYNCRKKSVEYTVKIMGMTKTSKSTV